MPSSALPLTEMVSLRLLLAHMIGDYALQTGAIAQYKAKGWSGLLTHVAIVTIVSGVLVAGMFPYWWGWVLLLGVIHLLVDQLRTFHIRELKAEFAPFYLLFDQALHVATILLIAWLGAGETPSQVWHALTLSSDLSRLWPVLVILLIFLVWTVAVLEMEVIRALSRVCRIPPPRGVLPLDRLLGANERLIAVILLLSPFSRFYLAAFLPRLYWSLHYKPEREPAFACSVRTLISALSATGVGLLLANLQPLQ